MFTISRQWFFELGAYDPEMRFWGGEELEISWCVQGKGRRGEGRETGWKRTRENKKGKRKMRKRRM